MQLLNKLDKEFSKIEQMVLNKRSKSRRVKQTDRVQNHHKELKNSNKFQNTKSK
jgi:hypothetical protein